MATKPLPDQALLNKLLRYEPETGKLFWRARPIEMFSSGGVGAKATHRTWNSKYAEKEAFPCSKPKGARGYIQAQIFKKKYLAHRIIWKMVTGDDPSLIDHINGDKTDNRFANLRDVSELENGQNLAMHSRNSSGCTGVMWNKQFERWHAFISVMGKRRHLGLYKSKDEAVLARKAGERKYGFHPNHGRKRPGAPMPI